MCPPREVGPNHKGANTVLHFETHCIEVDVGVWVSSTTDFHGSVSTYTSENVFFLIAVMGYEVIKNENKDHIEGRSQAGNWCSERLHLGIAFFWWRLAQMSGICFAHLQTGNGYYWDMGSWSNFFLR